ncbi:MAG TPA: SpoIVB peptidase S55 domain-containing protein [Acidobacteriota bacterium]|nr:SpoIVB peptidase S55 domain-containing protein [Acidobacteriota bacterium]
MTRKIRRAFLIGLALAAAVVAADAATITMPLSQVKPGMVGRGKSVFQGRAVEEFEVEILGVLENAAPKRSIILARLKGHGLETTGIIAGMSGSPVYIDGKLIGAVASGFSFSKEAIAGITPIEEMLAVGKAPDEPRPGATAPVIIRDGLSQEELSGAYLKTLVPAASESRSNQTFAPLELPLIISGLSAGAFEKARSFFAPPGFLAVRGGTGGQTRPSDPAAPPSLREGDAVGVQLLGGDLDISAVGTVTYVDGSKILAFGHPVYNLGKVDYAMTRADVITVMPSLESSFKLASVGPVIGRFGQDRTAGAAGEVGVMPRLIPLNIGFQTGPGVRKDFKLKLIADKFLTPALINMAVSGLVTSELRSYGEVSLDFSADVFLDKGGLGVHLEDLFSGSYDNSPVSLSGLLAAVVQFLMNNEFQDVGIFRIDLAVKALEETRLASLEKVLLDKYEVSPGEPIQLQAFYRTQNEESLVEKVTVLAPALPAGTEFQILVGDAASMQQVERSQYRIQGFVPRSLEMLVRMLGNLRKNNRIYFRLMAPKPGLFLKGEELPNLPPTLKSMFASPRASATGPTEITRSTLSEYQLAIPYVFKGMATIPVRIRK